MATLALLANMDPGALGDGAKGPLDCRTDLVKLELHGCGSRSWSFATRGDNVREESVPTHLPTGTCTRQDTPGFAWRTNA